MHSGTSRLRTGVHTDTEAHRDSGSSNPHSVTQAFCDAVSDTEAHRDSGSGNAHSVTQAFCDAVSNTTPSMSGAKRLDLLPICGIVYQPGNRT